MKNEKVASTFKSNDTEEWLDVVFTRKVGYLWARFFEKLGVHPNVVTVLSMIIGAGSALFFAWGSWYYCGVKGLVMNIIGVALLMWANFYDSADGQLARMTGKTTRLGRILDGAASEVWFIPIYLALVFRFWNYHSREFGWLSVPDTTVNAAVAALILLAVVCYSGFVCHAHQCGMADYYRQIHLFFLKGAAGAELDTSEAQQTLYDSTPWKGNVVWKAFLKTYVSYTRRQERKTPNFQKLMAKLKELYGSASNAPQEFRDKFRKSSLPLMKFCNILTFNTRAITLYACALLDLPWLYFIFETIVFSALCRYMRRRHENLCRELTAELEAQS